MDFMEVKYNMVVGLNLLESDAESLSCATTVLESNIVSQFYSGCRASRYDTIVPHLSTGWSPESILSFLYPPSL
jgi:hypothetical protein